MMDIRYGRKRSGIRRQLNKKLDDWLDSIDDKDLQTLVKKDVIVTGGSIASMLLGEKINDYDLYFRTKETTQKIAEYYVKIFNDAVKLKCSENVTPYKPTVMNDVVKNIKGEDEDRILIYIKSAGVASEKQGKYNYFESMREDDAAEFAETLIEDASDNKPRYRPVFMSQNAITLSDKVQLVIRFYGHPEEIHRNYDFAHAMCWYDYAENKLNLPAEALESLLSRTLVYKGSLYPIASIFRAKKFIERGWRVTAGQLLKVMLQISEIDLKDIDILREQLTGVDMAYMFQLLDAIKDIEPEKMDSAYICEIIDRIFN